MFSADIMGLSTILEKEEASGLEKAEKLDFGWTHSFFFTQKNERSAPRSGWLL